MDHKVKGESSTLLSLSSLMFAAPLQFHFQRLGYILYTTKTEVYQKGLAIYFQ